MNIGIIGPPGAGKSKLANKIRREVLPDAKVVDNYAQKLQRDTELALGPWANFSENFMVAGTRRAAELKVRHPEFHTLTVGTIVDTLMYCAIRSDSMIKGASQENLAFAQQWVESAMPAMGLWYRETWDYDIAVFCPADEDTEQRWTLGYSNELPGVFSSFLVPNVIGRSDDTLDYITEKLAETDKRGVRSS